MIPSGHAHAAPDRTKRYNVKECGQTIGRIRYAAERTPGTWLWNIQVHVTGGLPMGSANDLETAKAEFKAAWEAMKVRAGPEALASAFAAMNIRDDGFDLDEDGRGLTPSSTET